MVHSSSWLIHVFTKVRDPALVSNSSETMETPLLGHGLMHLKSFKKKKSLRKSCNTSKQRQNQACLCLWMLPFYHHMSFSLQFLREVGVFPPQSAGLCEWQCWWTLVSSAATTWCCVWILLWIWWELVDRLGSLLLKSLCFCHTIVL